MKNSIQILALLLLQVAGFNHVQAQNWLTTGNTGITPTNYLGTRNNTDLILKANADANPAEVARFTPGNSGWIGKGNVISSTVTGSFAAGKGNSILGSSSGAVALGENNTLSNLRSYAIGYNNIVSNKNAACFGMDLQATGDHSFVLGAGFGSGSRLTNNDPWSMVIGFVTPTMYINETQVSIGNIAPDPFYTLTVSGDVLANGVFLTSDKRFKKDIRTVDNALERVLALRGTQYYFRTDEFKDKNFSSEKQMGFIAQEMKEVFPELVHVNEKGEHSVNYTGIIPVLVEAIKEQETKIDEKDAAISCLQKQMETLEARLARLESAADQRSMEQPLKVFSVVPNPANGHFQVTLPETADAATVLIFDATGREVARQNTAAGENNIEFNLNLPNGIYNIAVMSKGKINNTKTLVISK